MRKKQPSSITCPKPQPKRKRDEGADVQQRCSNTIDPAVSLDDWLKEELNKRGAGDLFEAISMEVDKQVQKATNNIRKMFMEEIERQKDVYDSQRSIIICNPEYLIEDGMTDSDNKLTLVDQVTSYVHRLCKGAVSVNDAFIIRPRGYENHPKNVCIVLGSLRQKVTTFRILAAHMRTRMSCSTVRSRASMRDKFPRSQMGDVRRLVQRGLELKKGGRIASFKVCSRGTAAIPILHCKSSPVKK
jgi:hypothetical protein